MWKSCLSKVHALWLGECDWSVASFGLQFGAACQAFRAMISVLRDHGFNREGATSPPDRSLKLLRFSKASGKLPASFFV